MKTSFIIVCIISCSLMAGAGRVPGKINTAIAYGDTTGLPACLQQLNRGGVKSIRSYSGASRYGGIYRLPNGKTLYSFNAEASIGCNRNEPASVKYYNDSCQLVASFPRQFSIKQGFKPFIAEGYEPSDFAETKKGDYPAYFANEEKTATPLVENQTAAGGKKAGPQDPFPKEKSFTILKVHDATLPFKAGDVIKIHTKSGLWYFPKKKEFSQYKIVPQLSITKTQAQCKVPPCPVLETKELVYFMGSVKRFIKIANNIFFISTTQQADANTPTKAIELKWKAAFDLQADN